MSTLTVAAEIRRFLESSTPEVLCISGAWGVGKTYAWNYYLESAEMHGHLALRRYAYVSLFGLSSLTELRNSITESTVSALEPLNAPDISGLRHILRQGEALVRRSRPALDIAAGVFRIKDAGDALYRAAFLTVKNQLICLDDIERAVTSLDMREILGLVSMLREQRKCKIVLLLNLDKVEAGQKSELEIQLEKVVDTFLIFSPTSQEAVNIAISGDDYLSNELRNRIVSLDIKNIRTIKKIERWAKQLELFLEGRDKSILNQAVSTVVIAGWSFLQPDIAPPVEFVLKFNVYAGTLGKKDIAPEESSWRSILREYGYTSSDEFDEVIIDGVRSGYFSKIDLIQTADIVESRIAAHSRDNSFSKAWELYHSDLSVNDDDIVSAIYNGSLENLSVISPGNINGAITFLRGNGRNDLATDLVKKYIDTNKDNAGLFKNRNTIFFDDNVDAELLAALEAGRAAIADARDPAVMLKQLIGGSGFNPEEDVALLARLSPKQLVALFDENAGKDLKGMLEWAGRLAKQQGADALRANLTVALEEIAARSPMRAERLRNWGLLPLS